MALKSYRELEVWRKGMDLVVAVYEATAELPDREQYGLTAQIRRAAVSVPSNIAEGQGRKSTLEFKRHLSIALGSLNEVETCLYLAERLDLVAHAHAESLLGQCAELGRMINGLHAKLLSVRQLA